MSGEGWVAVEIGRLSSCTEPAPPTTMSDSDVALHREEGRESEGREREREKGRERERERGTYS